jgi:TolB protein
MRASLAFAACTIALALALSLRPAAAEPRIVTAQNSATPLTIALPKFVAGNPADDEIASSITRTIAADLRQSGALAPIDSQIADPAARALVDGRVERQSDGRIKIEVRLWDGFDRQLLTGQQYFISPEHWRVVAHIIADGIYERLTGKKGNFEADNRN